MLYYVQVYSYCQLLIMIIKYTAVSRPFFPPLPRSTSRIVNADTHLQPNNHTNCHIDSLKVVRGLQKSFEIDHSGFALTTSNNTIKVSMDSVAHTVLLIVLIPMHVEETLSIFLCHVQNHFPVHVHGL